MHKKPRTCLESYTHLKKSKIGFRFMIIAHHRALIENLFVSLIMGEGVMKSDSHWAVSQPTIIQQNYSGVSIFCSLKRKTNFQ